mmetsp:Transcript_29100/g.37521  ORF Transcript_29100/g.37521 Transcript_29100/m.37521 type:complete len:305 (-) Transcript_29100:154-1068(-)
MARKKKNERLSEEEISKIQQERKTRREEAKAQEIEDEQKDSSIWELNYEFTSTSVRMMEDWDGSDGAGGSLAGIQWIGGVVLSRFLDCLEVFPPKYFQGKRCLELGAGCALPSLLLAKLGAEVTITDIDTEKCLPNIELNLSPQEQQERVRVRYLCWGDYSNEAELSPPFDIILAGDCMYQDACVEPFLQTMWRFSDSKTEIYVAGVVGSSPYRLFVKLVGIYFEITRIDTTKFDGVELESVKNVGEGHGHHDHRGLWKLSKKGELSSIPQSHQEEELIEKSAAFDDHQNNNLHNTSSASCDKT